MNDEQEERISTEIKPCLFRKRELYNSEQRLQNITSVTQQSIIFLDGMIHALEWVRSNL